MKNEDYLECSPEKIVNQVGVKYFRAPLFSEGQVIGCGKVKDRVTEVIGLYCNGDVSYTYTTLLGISFSEKQLLDAGNNIQPS